MGSGCDTIVMPVRERGHDRPFRIEIIDLNGRVVREEVFSPYQALARMDVSGLQEHVYFYRVFVDGALVKNGKLVKMRGQ